MTRNISFATHWLHPLALTAALASIGYLPSRLEAQARTSPAAARPALIKAEDGEKRFLRGGAAPLWIKVDPVTTGSTRMVLGRSDLPPGDAIAVHRHHQED